MNDTCDFETSCAGQGELFEQTLWQYKQLTDPATFTYMPKLK